MVALRAVSRGVPAMSATMTRIATLRPEAPIDEAVQVLLQTSQGEFPVVDDGNKPVGLLGRADIIRALKELGPQASVGQVMNKDFATIDRRAPLDDALRVLQEKSAPAIAVVEPDGRLVGLISTETVGELMLVSQAMPQGFKLGPDSGTRSGPWSKPAGA
jgi:stage IV sporulation protein FB